VKKANLTFIIATIIVVASIIFGTFYVRKRLREGEQRAFDTGKSHYDKQNYDAAVQHLNAYLKKYPKGKNAPEAIYYLAISHQESEDYTNATQFWDKVISHNPTTERKQEAHYNLGLCQENLGKFDLAIGSYDVAGNGPDASFACKALLQQASLHEKGKNDAGAANAYRRIVDNFADSESAREAGKKLGKLNLEHLLEENSITYQVESGDLISKIAGKHNTTSGLIIKANNIDPRRIRVGLPLKIPRVSFTFETGTEDKLAFLKYKGLIVKQYPIAVGKSETPTPIGIFEVIQKLIDPTWYSPDESEPIPPNDPRNQLGTRWLGFENSETMGRGFGIHGTIEPESIGQAQSNGCIRMHNEDVEELFDLLLMGSEIKITKQLQPGKWYSWK